MVVYGMPIALDMLHRFSDDEIEQLSRRNPNYAFERLPEGELLVSPPLGWQGGRDELRLGRRLADWNDRAGGGGEVFGPSTGFTLPDGALLSPDAAWLDAARYAELQQKQPLNKFAPVCPTIAFEIVSPSDLISVLRRKIESYVRNGATRAILIDPERRFVEVSSKDALHATLADPAAFTIPLKALPGATEPIHLDLSELFS